MQNLRSSDIKASAREAIEQLPDDVMYRIYVRQKIEAGLRDAEKGNTVTTSEVRARYGLPGDG